MEWKEMTEREGERERILKWLDPLLLSFALFNQHSLTLSPPLSLSLSLSLTPSLSLSEPSRALVFFAQWNSPRITKEETEKSEGNRTKQCVAAAAASAARHSSLSLSLSLSVAFRTYWFLPVRLSPLSLSLAPFRCLHQFLSPHQLQQNM